MSGCLLERSVMMIDPLSVKRTVRVGDIDISCEIFGGGCPLLLVMGLGGVKELWSREFIAPLADRYAVVTFDSRGMGRTTTGALPVGISRMAHDAAGLLASLGIGRAHVLGYSMGGYVAQELALEHPSVVDRLVLVSTECGGAKGIRVEPGVLFEFHGGDSPVPGSTRRSFFLTAEWLKENPGGAGDIFGTLGHEPDREGLERQAEAVREWSGACARLPGITNPTLVITGTDDIVIMPENARVLSELIPESTLVTVEGAGHGFLLQFPAELGFTVRRFLDRGGPCRELRLPGDNSTGGAG